MADQLKNMMIGLFVLAAVAIIVFALMFLHPSVGDEKRVLRVRFANIDKISVGTRVSFAGKPVGEVAAITELKDAISERVPRDGIIYVYELVLHVDSNVNVFNTDEIAARTSGLLGEKSVVITPMPPSTNEPLRLVNDEILYAFEVGGVEDAIKELKLIGAKAENALDIVIQILTDIQQEKIVDKLSHTMQNVSDITDSFNQPETWKNVIGNIDNLSNRAIKSWDNVDKTLGDVNQVSLYIKEGQGTVGRVLMTDQLYLKLNALLSKGETVMNDINHYGVLFNMDKGWQRLRARRMNLLYRLSSPQEFRNFFNEEIDQINTSLSRVYSVVESSAGNLSCDECENREFDKVYSELLRRIADTEEALKMYNQQRVDENTRCTEPCP